MPELDIDGCMDFFGAHIKLCMEDYATVHRHIHRLEALVVKNGGKRRRRQSALLSGRIQRVRNIITNYETARSYIFGKGLVKDIFDMDLPLSIEFVRAQTTKMAESCEFNNTMELGV